MISRDFTDFNRGLIVINRDFANFYVLPALMYLIMVEEKYLLSSLTEQVIGCAMRVHSSLGNGFPEVIYQRALAVELEVSGIGFAREREQPVYYRDVRIGSRIVDFLVQEQLLIELKAASELIDSNFSQIINYLTAFKLEVGLLINFGQKSLQYRRFIKTKP